MSLGRTAAIISYKLRFFFGPAFRGRFGAFVYLGLILIFVPSGWAAGFGIGSSLRDASPEAAVEMLSLPLAAILSLGLLYSLGTGVTAHVSEFDFFMTAPLRPREFLAADLVFQFLSLLVSGGLAAGIAAISIVMTVGRPVETAVALLAILVAYACLVLMVSQILVVLRVRYPRAPVRSLTLVLLVLSALPSISIARPDFPLRFTDLPAPSSAFGTLGVAALGFPVPGTPALGIAMIYLGVVLGVWVLASDAYIFHGIRPSLSAGFGQVDMASRIDTQRRLIGGLGRLTTRIGLRTDRGGETGLMARLHLIRIWRDGSVFFILLFAAVAILPTVVGGGDSLSSVSIGVTQVLTFLIAILAMNWAYYERENLWLVITSTGRPGSYFRGLFLALAGIGLAVSAAFLVVLYLTTGTSPPVESIALPLAGPIVSATTAAAIMTRAKLKPAAFSPAILGILFAVSITGFLGGLLGEGIVRAAGLFAGLGGAALAGLLAGYVIGMGALGLWGVTRLAANFRL
jgi:hypothetical protein